MIIDLALLIRVMFRPFDGTAILLERCPNDSAIAKVKVKDDGMLDFFSLPRLLGKYAELDDDVVLKSAPYKATSLLEIRLDIEAVQSFDQLIPAQPGGDDSSDEQSSDGEKEMKARLNLLRRAAGEQRGRGRGVQKKGKQTKGPMMPPKPKDGKKARAKAKAKATTGASSRDCFADGDDPNEPGAAGEAHDSLVIAWSQALDEQQGPLPLQPPSSSKGKVAAAGCRDWWLAGNLRLHCGHGSRAGQGQFVEPSVLGSACQFGEHEGHQPICPHPVSSRCVWVGGCQSQREQAPGAEGAKEEILLAEGFQEEMAK